MSRPFPKRFRTEERIRTLTATLTSDRLPRSFYELLERDGIDSRRSLLVDLNEDQGSWLGGRILTREKAVLDFEVEFSGSGGYGDYENRGAATIEVWSRRDLQVVLADPAERGSSSANHPLRIADELVADVESSTK